MKIIFAAAVAASLAICGASAQVGPGPLLSPLPPGGNCAYSQPNATALLHFDGTNGATTTTDVYGHTVTATNAQLSTTQKFFGPSSANNTSTAAGSYWKVGTGSADFQFGTGPFTIDFRAFITATDYSNSAAILAIGPDNGGIVLRAQNSGKINIFWNSVNIAGTSNSITVGAWNYIKVARLTTSLYLIVNGANDASSPFTIGAGTSQTSSHGMEVGGSNDTTAFTSLSTGSYIDEVRVMKGTADISLPVPALPWCN